jgi:IclR family KDG regulon transcriptional repressor
MYVEKKESLFPIIPKSWVGLRAPAFCVATGRPLLTFQLLSEIEAVLSQHLKRFTPETIIDADELRTLLERMRRECHTTNRNNWREEVCGMAAPVLGHSGRVVASVELGVPESRVAPSNARVLTDHTLAATAVTSAGLGFVSVTFPDASFRPNAAQGGGIRQKRSGPGEGGRL